MVTNLTLAVPLLFGMPEVSPSQYRQYSRQGAAANSLLYNSSVQRSHSVSARRLILFIPFLLAMAGCHSATSYLEKGNDLFARGQFADATLNYHKAIQKDADLGDAYYRAGLSEMKQNKAAEALQDLQQAVRLLPTSQPAKMELTNLLLGAYIGDPQRPKFLYDLLLKFSSEWLAKDANSMPGLRIKGYVAMLEQRPEEAVEVFRRAHQLYPHDEKTVDGLMDALFRANQPAEAERVGQEFLATDPKASDIYDALYRIYAAGRRADDAEKILTRKVNADPGQNAYLLQLATFYAGTHKRQEMEQTIQKFLSNPGSDAYVHLEAGDFYASVGDRPSALREYRAGNTNAKDRLLYQNRIARILLIQGNRKEGLQVLNQTVAQFPDDPESRALHAALLVGEPGAGKSGDAIQELRALVDKDPKENFLKFLLARALAESNNLAEARSRLLEIVKARPQFLDAHILLADIAFKRGDALEAIQQAEAALEIDPQNLRARMLRGSALLRQGNIEEANSVLGSLARQVPESVDVQLQLAYVTLNQRKYGEAESAFNKILEKHPGDPRVLAGLVDTELVQNRPEKAYARLEAELSRSHGSPGIRYLMATTALRSGKYNDAIENLRTLAPNCRIPRTR